MDQLKKNENDYNLPEKIFNLEYNEKLIHQIIISYTSNSHKRIKKQKNRSEVRGGGKKPWRQKGTGRARAGSIRSPLWRGGGKIFAARGIKKKYKKINKKAYRLGMKIILSQMLKEERLEIIDTLHAIDFKTKNFIKNNKKLIETHNNLIITDMLTDDLILSTNNIKNLKIITYKKINPILLIKSKKIYITKISIEKIKEYLK